LQGGKEASAKSFVKSMKRKHAKENTKITRAAYKESKAGFNAPIIDESKS